jgi:regulator of replication initiation timing
MNSLKLLEEKLTSLVEIVKELKTENAKLAEENAQLSAKLLMLESVNREDGSRLKELSKEQELARVAVDDLIKSIDSLVGSQN